MSSLKRLHSATGSVALVVALLALVASAAGVGYAAATIGTSDIKNNAITAKKIKKNAVTSKKVKDGSLKTADLVAEEKQIVPPFTNGGEGDCIWQNADALIPGLAKVTYRKNRFGIVRLTGTAQALDGPGGDGICNPSAAGQAADGIAFLLPASHMPAKTQLVFGDGSGVLIVGPMGLVSGPTSLPPGAVYMSGSTLLLDGVTFDAAGSGVVVAKTKSGGRWDASLLKQFGIN